MKIATEAAPRPTQLNAALPASVDAWFVKACAREPEARFSSAKEMADAFRAALGGVVSRTSSGVNNDSGERGGSSGARALEPVRPARSSGSGGTNARSEPPPASPTFGFAATALDDSEASRARALGRSEAGVSVAEGDRRGASRGPVRLYIGGGIVLSTLVGIVLVLGARLPPNGPMSASASARNVPSGTPARESSTPPESGGTTSASADPSADARTSEAAPSDRKLVDAAAQVPPSVRGPPSARPSHAGVANGPVSSGRSPEPSAKPAATPKPTDTAPDLF